AAWLMAIIYGLTACGQLDDATPDFRARFGSIFLGDQAAFDLNLQFRKLIAVNSEVMLGVGRRFLLAQEWVHHCDRGDGCQESGYDPEYHAHSNSDFTTPCQLRQLRRFGQSTGHALRSIQERPASIVVAACGAPHRSRGALALHDMGIWPAILRTDAVGLRCNNRAAASGAASLPFNWLPGLGRLKGTLLRCKRCCNFVPRQRSEERRVGQEGAARSTTRAD